jgi:hypothetical protein
MNKFMIPLGLAAMIAATPAFAATPKHVMHKHASHATMCMVKGKKVACSAHAMHHAKKAPAVYKKK